MSERYIVLAYMLAIILLFYYISFSYYKRMAIDRFQALLFKSRDNWFDYAQVNNLLDNPGYNFVRTFYNKTIGDSDRFTPLALAYILLVTRSEKYESEKEDFVKIFGEARASIGQEHEEEFNNHCLELFRLILWQVFHSSMLASFAYESLKLIFSIIQLSAYIVSKREKIVHLLVGDLDWIGVSSSIFFNSRSHQAEVELVPIHEPN